MDELVVGSRLQNPTHFDRLPIGTVIGETGGQNTFIKQVDGWLNEGNGSVYSISDFSMGYNEVRSIPKGKAVTWESLAQWQFRYRDNCFMSADSAGISRRTVLDAMAELGVGDDRFPMGRGVKVGNNYDKDRLAIDTQVTVGRPEVLSGFGLFVKRVNGWVHLLGDQGNFDGHRVTVVSGDPVAWAVEPGTAAEQEALANFKARAWRVGWKVKQNNRWCESYEEYMSRIGLTEDVLQGVTHGGYTLGEMVNINGAALLPAGSVLRWINRHDDQVFTWYIRDDTMTNASKTRALFGHRRDGSPLRNSASRMEVMWIANEDPMMLRVPNLTEIVEHLPPGTVFDASGTAYVLCHDHRVTTYSRRNPVPDTGTWTVDQLGASARVTGFPS